MTTPALTAARLVALRDPNSLALDAKNNVLFVSIKNGEKDDKGADESVARIQL